MKVSKRRRKLKLQVHGLWSGGALCGFSEHVPGAWPPGHSWAHPIHNGMKINCEDCKMKAAKLRREYRRSLKAKRQEALAAT